MGAQDGALSPAFIAGTDNKNNKGFHLQSNNITSRLLRLPRVLDKTGLSKSTLYDYVKAGKFPRQVKLGVRSSAWREHEVDAWVSSRPVTEG